MKAFDFYNPTQIIFGNNRLNEVGKKVKQFTKTNNILIVVSNSSIKNGYLKKIEEELEKENINYYVFDKIVSNPNLNNIDEATKIIRENNIDFILAVGGASAIDTGKTICVAAYNSKDIWDLICNPQEISGAIPLGVVITLYGSGTEMTNGAVITNCEIPKKRGFDSQYMYPKFSIMDPLVLRTVPKDYLMIGATDMLIHVLEVYFEITLNDNLSDPYLELLAKQIITEIDKFKNDNQDNEKLFWLSTLAQNKFLSFDKENNGEWIAHIISHEFCLKYNFPHGRIVAVLFLAWLNYIKRINENRIINFGKFVYELDNPSTDDVINRIKDSLISLGNKTSLSEMGVKKDDLDELIDNAMNGKILGKYKRLTKNDVKGIIYGCFDSE